MEILIHWIFFGFKMNKFERIDKFITSNYKKHDHKKFIAKNCDNPIRA